jgi:hypothetical protein
LLSVRQPVDTFFTERDKNLPPGDLELREQRAIPDFRANRGSHAINHKSFL